MSLERRLTDALHQLDRYQPSPDLFDRTNLSIAEDLAHRRRLRIGIASSAAFLLALVLFFGAVIEKDALGRLVVPRWSMVSAQSTISLVLLVSLAPMIRRYGQTFVSAAFHLAPESGRRFSKLLDIAYYMTFGGLIVATVSLTDLSSLMEFPADLGTPLSEIGRFLLAMGVAHALNLAAIPVVGLIFNAVARRARRYDRGDEAPPEARGATRADRVATWVVYSIVAMLLLPVLIVAVVAVGGLLA